MTSFVKVGSEEVTANIEDASTIVTRTGFTFTSASLIDVSTVEDKPIDWLVYPYFIRGAITTVEGDSDMGKSLAMTDFAARVTANKPFPDGLIRKYDGAQGVVFIAYEDDIAQAVKPRFIKAGGDTDRFKVIRFVDDGNGPRGLDLTRASDLELLEYAIDSVDAAFIIIDPITSALGNIDINQTGDARNALLPLLELADRKRVALANLRHFRKSNEGGYRQKGIGSMAFQEMARVGLAFSYNPKDDSKETRLILGFKHNYSGRFKSLQFGIKGGQNATPVVDWQGESDVTEEQALEASKPLGNVKQEILKIVEEFNGVAETGAIVKELVQQGESAGNVRKQLRELADTGKLVNPKHGVYWLPAAYEKAS